MKMPIKPSFFRYLWLLNIHYIPKFAWKMTITRVNVCLYGNYVLPLKTNKTDNYGNEIL